MRYIYQNYPTGPYCYNDPNITYNEECFCYNGGFDLTCLIAPRRIAGRVSQPKKSYPAVEMVDLVFKTCIEYVNDKKLEEEEACCIIKKYSFEKKDSMDVRTKITGVKRKIMTITTSDFAVNQGVSKEPTRMSSSLTKLSPYVSSSLVFNKPKKIKISTSAIKNKNNKNEK